MAEYIKREDVLREYDKEQRRNGPWRFETLIESIPAADVSPVLHGQWILVDTDKWIGVCSNCNRQDSIDHLAKHCRFCGARMDLEVPNEAKESRQP